MLILWIRLKWNKPGFFSNSKLSSFSERVKTLEKAIEACHELNGRLPHYNILDDFDKLGALHTQTDVPRTWVSSVYVETMKASFRDLILTEH